MRRATREEGEEVREEGCSVMMGGALGVGGGQSERDKVRKRQSEIQTE